MHTILGAGGAVANALTRELSNHNETIRLVSRKPISNPNKNVSWKKADLLNFSELLEVCKGSSVIYLTDGLIYDKNIWKAHWPVILRNVINLAKDKHNRLILFVHVYMTCLVYICIT